MLKRFSVQIFPRAESLSLALNGLHFVQCYCWYVYVYVCVFLRDCESVLIAVVMVDVATHHHLPSRHRRRYCLNTDFRFKDAYSCLEIYFEPLTFLLVLSLFRCISCRNVSFFHFISCSCWSMVLLRVLCCFAHYFYLLSVHSQCDRVRSNVLPSRRSTLWRDSMVFLSTFVSSTLHRIPILFTYVSGFHFISFHFAINKLKRAEKNIYFLFFTHLI